MPARTSDPPAPAREPVTVLLTCGGGPGILAQVTALRTSRRYAARVILADAEPASGNLFLPEVDARYRIPPCDAPEFLDALCRLVAREQVDVLYSGLDEEIPVIARERARIEALGCRLVMPPAAALELALDKEAAHHALEGRVPLPRTWFLDDGLDGGAVWAELEGRVVIKVTTSRGGRHIYMPEDREEFLFRLERLRALSRADGLRFLVQERIDGDEYNVSCLHDHDGRVVYAVSRRKFERRKVKSTTTAAAIEHCPLVIEPALDAVSALGLVPGFNNVEIIVGARDGVPYHIEVNGGRTAAQDMNLVAAGINITDLMIDLAMGRAVAPVPHPPDGTAILKIRRDVVVTLDDIARVPSPFD